MDIEQFRKAGYQAIDRICDLYYSLQDRPVIARVEPGYLRHALPDSAPEKGEEFQAIVDDYQQLIVPGLTHWQHPSFFAYFPTGFSFESVLGDLYASSTPNPGFNWSSSPACTELEAVMMDWSAKLFGLSDVFMNKSGVGGGALQISASDSCLIAVVAARSLYLRKHPDAKIEDLVIYTTTQTHSVGSKAGLVLGINVAALEVTSEDSFGLRGETLRRALDKDYKSGKHPFILIATIGTTSTGANDNLPEIGQVSQDYPDLWIHVDAAWAGVALACPEYREQLHLEAINKYAHSFCTNFHKWGLVNFDASTLWVRDRQHLIEALDITPAFLKTKHEGTVIDYRNWHLGLGRRFRSLKLWFVLRGFGVEGFQKNIRQAIQHNEKFSEFIVSSPSFALFTKPTLALTVFTLRPQVSIHGSDAPVDLPLKDLNDLNRLFFGRLSARDDIFISHTEVDGKFCIRFAIGSQRTQDSHIVKACEIFTQEAESALVAWKDAKI